MSVTQIARAIAFYLPQYHPIPENDEWWGAGFTEWTNVVRSKPLFPGHYQPQLPTELGFYDLRVPEVRERQAELAKQYGIYGFCYYHYWFNGKRLLNLPIDQILETKRPDFPFCLCWANENWTRRWDGQDQQILIQQNYSETDDREHIRWLLRVFSDDRYIRVDGKPLFLVYRTSYLPNPLKTTTIWREEAHKAGIGELFLCRVDSFLEDPGDPNLIGFDGAVDFQPKMGLHPPLWNRVLRWMAKRIQIELPRIYDYPSVVRLMLRRSYPGYCRFPCVIPSWDNTARRRKSAPTIYINSSPERYEAWLSAVVQGFLPESTDQKLVFINAWNEWAEGCHLEPCEKWGRAYLEATARALQGVGNG
jgi:lipopolysaccharide biosynthesis protein